MDKNIKKLVSICVRGGSKGVPGKNIRLLNGIPLFVHSLNQAKESKLFDVTAVSSDSDEILNSRSLSIKSKNVFPLSIYFYNFRSNTHFKYFLIQKHS